MGGQEFSYGRNEKEKGHKFRTYTLKPSPLPGIAPDRRSVRPCSRNGMGGGRFGGRNLFAAVSRTREGCHGA